jgi:dipeptidyl aminopeptidase/acylaminoacyl peptidase
MLQPASRGLFDVSQSGVLVFQSGSAVEGNQLTWVDAGGREIGKLGEPSQHDDPIRISPDGKSVAVAVFDANLGTPDIWLYDIARGIRTRFTTDAASDNNPNWSPDGKRIAFSSSRQGQIDVFIKEVEGSNQETLLYSSASDNFCAAWSPDGRTILTGQLIRAGGGWQIAAIDVDSKTARNVMTLATSYDVNFSPSGNWIVYDTIEGSDRETFVSTLSGEGRKWQVSSAGGFYPCWVGSHIYYFNETGVLRTEVVERSGSIDIGKEELLFETTGLIDFEIMPDENRFLLLRSSDAGNRKPLSIVSDWRGLLPSTP